MERNVQFLRFDEIEIDLAGRRVHRAGMEQALEPKAFAVLVLMAGQPGRAFQRDEILDAVWGHTHITPGTLNRIITLLRHALGEDAHAPHYLHTVHGVGYRFDAQVQACDTNAALAATNPNAPHASTAGAQDGMRAARAPAPLPIIAGAVPVAPAVSDTGDAVAAEGGRRSTPQSDDSNAGTHRAILLVLMLAVLAALLAWQWRRDRTPVAKPEIALAVIAAKQDAASAPAVAPVLAVLPLRPLGDDARGADFADGLSEELISLLARIEGLRVTSRTSSFQFRDAQTSLADIAQRLDATHLLEGSVRQDGTRLRISLRLVEASNDRALWSETFDREFEDIFAIQDSIARAVGETLRLQLALLPSSGRSGEDPELYRRYLLARQPFDDSVSSSSSGLAPAAEQLRALVIEHPDYARAWGGLAATQWFRARQPGPESDAWRREAEAASATALRLDPDQPDAHAVLAGQACSEQRWAACLRLSRRAVQGAPSDTKWRSWHAHRLATVGYVAEALREQEHALALDPLATSTHVYLGRLLDTVGRHEEARRHLQLGGLPGAHTASFFNAVWRHDYVEARRLTELWGPGVRWRASQLAVVDALEHPERWPQAMAAIDAAERALRAKGDFVPYDFVRFVLPERNYALDIAGLDAVQRGGYASYNWIFWMPGERALRQSPAFQNYIRSSGLLDFWREHSWPDMCRSDGGEGVVCD